MPKPSSFGQEKPIHLLRANLGLLAGNILELREAMECICLLPMMLSWQCGPSRGIPDHPVGENHSKSAQPAYTDSPVKRLLCRFLRRKQPPLWRPAEGSTTFWTPNENQPEGTIPKSIPWVEGGVAPL